MPLAGSVIHLTGVPPQAHHGAQVHNPAIPLLHHRPGHRLHAQKGALQVGVHHRVKVRLAHPHGQAVPGDPGAVHQDVHAAKGLQGLGHQGLDRRLIGDAALDRAGRSWYAK